MSNRAVLSGSKPHRSQGLERRGAMVCQIYIPIAWTQLTSEQVFLHFWGDATAPWHHRYGAIRPRTRGHSTALPSTDAARFACCNSPLATCRPLGPGWRARCAPPRCCSAKRLEGCADLGREDSAPPSRRNGRLVDLVEVADVRVARLHCAASAKISPGNVVKPNGIVGSGRTSCVAAAISDRQRSGGDRSRPAQG